MKKVITEILPSVVIIACVIILCYHLIVRMRTAERALEIMVTQALYNANAEAEEAFETQKEALLLHYEAMSILKEVSKIDSLIIQNTKRYEKNAASIIARPVDPVRSGTNYNKFWERHAQGYYVQFD